jgi:hypothetical protein
VLADVGDGILARRIDAANERAAIGVARAAALTRGSFDAMAATACQSMSCGIPRISMCDATARMRLRSSSWNPFITESTTISAATPSAMPAIEISEMNEMNVLRPEPLRARV